MRPSFPTAPNSTPRAPNGNCCPRPAKAPPAPALTNLPLTPPRTWACQIRCRFWAFPPGATTPHRLGRVFFFLFMPAELRGGGGKRSAPRGFNRGGCFRRPPLPWPGQRAPFGPGFCTPRYVVWRINASRWMRLDGPGPLPVISVAFPAPSSPLFPRFGRRGRLQPVFSLTGFPPWTPEKGPPNKETLPPRVAVLALSAGRGSPPPLTEDSPPRVEPDCRSRPPAAPYRPTACMRPVPSRSGLGSGDNVPPPPQTLRLALFHQVPPAGGPRGGSRLLVPRRTCVAGTAPPCRLRGPRPGP